MNTLVFIGLGSNIGNRREILDTACRLIAQRIGPLTARSSWYETQPWGFDSPHPFLNGALACHTTLTPQDLLHVLHQIETELGRKRFPQRVGYNDRTLDLDILFYDDLCLESPTLTIPHPLFAQRAFVLDPLYEIAPDWRDPRTQKTIRQLHAALSDPIE